MYLEMIQDKRGPYLCISGVGKSLACLPSQKISQECSAPSALPQIPAPRSPDGCSRSRGPQRLHSHLTFCIPRAPPGMPAPILISAVLKVFPHSLLSLIRALAQSVQICVHILPALAEPALIC